MSKLVGNGKVIPEVFLCTFCVPPGLLLGTWSRLLLTLCLHDGYMGIMIVLVAAEHYTMCWEEIELLVSESRHDTHSQFSQLACSYMCI